jgi:hypothetical protein
MFGLSSCTVVLPQTRHLLVKRESSVDTRLVFSSYRKINKIEKVWITKTIEPTQTLWTYAKRIDRDFRSMDSRKFEENTGIRVRTVSQDINPTANHTS